MKTVTVPIAIILTFLTFVVAGCKQSEQPAGPRYGSEPVRQQPHLYTLAVHPLHNPSKLIEAYQPLIDLLNSHLQTARLSLEASRDYANFEEKYRERRPDFILPNPWQTLQAMKSGYSVIAMAGEPKDFKGIFVVRVDSGIRLPGDLKGKSVSYPSPTALAACIMPQYFLFRHGINVNTDIENRFVGSQESAIMNAWLGKTSAGATWPPPWRAFQKEHPSEAAQLKVIWETESLVNNSVMVRNDVPADLQEKVVELLLGLSKTEKGRSILANMETASFLPATDRDYDVVRNYVSRFEREVRPVEQR